MTVGEESAAGADESSHPIYVSKPEAVAALITKAAKTLSAQEAPSQSLNWSTEKSECATRRPSGVRFRR